MCNRKSKGIKPSSTLFFSIFLFLLPSFSTAREISVENMKVFPIKKVFGKNQLNDRSSSSSLFAKMKNQSKLKSNLKKFNQIKNQVKTDSSSVESPRLAGLDLQAKKPPKTSKISVIQSPTEPSKYLDVMHPKAQLKLGATKLSSSTKTKLTLPERDSAIKQPSFFKPATAGRGVTRAANFKDGLLSKLNPNGGGASKIKKVSALFQSVKKNGFNQNKALAALEQVQNRSLASEAKNEARGLTEQTQIGITLANQAKRKPEKLIYFSGATAANKEIASKTSIGRTNYQLAGESIDPPKLKRNLDELNSIDKISAKNADYIRQEVPLDPYTSPTEIHETISELRANKKRKVIATKLGEATGHTINAGKDVAVGAIKSAITHGASGTQEMITGGIAGGAKISNTVFETNQLLSNQQDLYDKKINYRQFNDNEKNTQKNAAQREEKIDKVKEGINNVFTASDLIKGTP